MEIEAFDKLYQIQLEVGSQDPFLFECLFI